MTIADVHCRLIWTVCKTGAGRTTCRTVADATVGMLIVAGVGAVHARNGAAVVVTACVVVGAVGHVLAPG